VHGLSNVGLKGQNLVLRKVPYIQPLSYLIVQDRSLPTNKGYKKRTYSTIDQLCQTISTIWLKQRVIFIIH